MSGPLADLAFDVRATLAVRGAVAVLAPRLPRLTGGRAAVVGRVPGRAYASASEAPHAPVASPPFLHLTYDDGPDPATTPALIEALGGARATFFVLADAVRAHPDLARQIGAAGHGLGLHGPTHADPWRQRVPAAAWSEAADAIEQTAGAALVAVRPPYGHLTPGLAAWARGRDLPVWLWDVMPGDFRPDATAGRVAASVRRWARPGSLVVLHEGPTVARASVGATRLLALGEGAEVPHDAAQRAGRNGDRARL